MSTVLTGGGASTLDALSVAGAASIGGALTLGSPPILTSAQSMVRVNTANGHGSTNTVIRRFTNVVTNQGSDITYTDSATLGATFTVNTAGVYGISYSDTFTGGDPLGISLNSTQLTTSISSITGNDVLSYGQTPSASAAATVATVVFLPSGSVIRAHTAGTAGSTSKQQFTITRVA